MSPVKGMTSTASSIFVTSAGVAVATAAASTAGVGTAGGATEVEGTPSGGRVGAGVGAILLLLKLL